MGKGTSGPRQPSPCNRREVGGYDLLTQLQQSPLHALGHLTVSSFSSCKTDIKFILISILVYALGDCVQGTASTVVVEEFALYSCSINK